MKNFEIIRELGRGGIATVYLVRDRKTGRYYALKKLNNTLLKNHKFVKRFLREAQIGKILNHPNIVKVFDVIEEGDDIYILMEYIDGKTLSQFMNEKKLMDFKTVKYIVISILKALSYANKRGLVAHRDIKPSNIMIDKDGNVKVMDFGIAKVVGSDITTSTLIFTPKYASPEQIKGNKVDIRSDLYSLGVMTYEMLSGRPPFDANTPAEVIYKHLQEIPKPLTYFRKNIPVELLKFVDRCLKKDPGNRYSSADEALNDLVSPNTAYTYTKKVIPSISQTLKRKQSIKVIIYSLLFILISTLVISSFVFSNYKSRANSNKTSSISKYSLTEWISIQGNLSHFMEIKENFKSVKLDWHKDMEDEIWCDLISSQDKIYVFTHSGRGFSLFVNSGKEVWKKTDLPFPIVATPTIMDNMILVPARNSVVALSKFDGEVYWRFKTNNRVTASPLFYKGRIYVFSHDGYLYILNRFGNLINKIWLNEDFVSLTPAIYKNYLIFVSFRGFLNCYSLDNPENLKEIWKENFNASPTSIPVVAKDGRIYVAFSNKIYSLDFLNKKKIWEFVGEDDEEFRGLTVADDLVILTSFSNKVIALNKENGESVWQEILPEPLYKPGKFSSPGIVTNPLIVGDSIFITSSNGKLYRINLLNGEVINKWKTDTERAIFSSPTLNSDRVFFGTLGGIVYCFKLID